MNKNDIVLWTEAVNSWYDQQLIASSKIMADNKILLMPGKIDSFGFHFSRDLIPVKGDFVTGIEPELKLQSDKSGNYIISFQTWDSISKYAQTVFETLRKRSITNS